MSPPEVRASPNGSDRENNDMIAAPLAPEPLSPNAPPTESHTILPAPPAAPLPLPVIPQPSKEILPLMSAPSAPPLLVNPTPTAVSIPPHLPSPTPVVQMASVSQATSLPIISKTSQPPVLCSAGASCSVTATKSVDSMSSVPQKTQGSHQSPARLSFSTGEILFSCVVGITTLGIMCAILNCSLRRWRNKKQRRSDDLDVWKFLENTKDFSGFQNETKNGFSVKSTRFEHDFYPHESHLINLQPTLGFESHLQPQNLARCHFADFRTQPPHTSHLVDEQSITNFIDEQGMSWVAPSVAVSSQYHSLLLPPHDDGPTPEPIEAYQGGCTIPQPVFRKTSIVGNLCDRSTMYILSPQATIARPASVTTRVNKMTSKHESLTQVTSPEQSNAVEGARQGIADQQPDLRTTLRAAIQRKNDSDEELLESLMFLWHDKSYKTPTDIVRFQNVELPPQGQLCT